MKISIKAYCKRSKPRHTDGLCPLYIRLKEAYTKEVLVATGKYISPKNFNNKIGYYQSSSKTNNSTNLYIKGKLEAIDNLIYSIEKSGVEVSCKIIKDKFLNNESNNNFIDFAYLQIKNSVGLSERTVIDYNYCISKLDTYCPKIPFKEITHEFLEEYRRHLIDIKGRSHNGIYHDFAIIRKTWRQAMSKDIVTHYPFSNFKLKKEEVNKEYIFKEEAEKLIRLWESKVLSKKLQRTLYYFLLSCFTGLRKKDMHELSILLSKEKGFTKKLIEQGVIKVKTSKSRYKKEVAIPIFSKLKTLLETPEELALKLSSSRISEDLIEICKEAGIQKKLTFHSSRHSFAVISIQLGIDLLVVQNILGHSSIKTTEIYLHIVESHKSQQMSKWDNF